MRKTAIDIPTDRLAELCRQYQVRELALFGSVLRDDFGPESDIDLLVEFEPAAQVGFLTLGKLQAELTTVFQRAVDLVPKRGLKPVIRQAVLASAEVVYAA